MKLFHTADWHIGKLVHKLYMTEDQTYLLKKLKDIILAEKPDVLIIAGDIYDRSIPPASAVELLNAFFTQIITESKTKIIAISGNHDSPDRLNFGSSILKKQGLHISTHIEHIFKPIEIEDVHGIVRFYTIPFLEPELVRDYFEDPSIHTFDDVFARLMTEIQLDKAYRNVCIAHGYVTAGDLLEESDSEKPLTIGGSSYVSSRYFEAFDYVALGHLHGPQRVGKDHIRYAGSLMKYSFSEVRQRKAIQVVDLGLKGNVELSEKALVPEKDFRLIKGELDQLVQKKLSLIGNSQDYIKAVLTDQGEVLNAFSKLKAIYPNVLSVEFERNKELEDSDYQLDSRAVARKSTESLFTEFYEWVELNAITPEESDLLTETCNVILKEEREA